MNGSTSPGSPSQRCPSTRGSTVSPRRADHVGASETRHWDHVAVDHVVLGVVVPLALHQAGAAERPSKSRTEDGARPRATDFPWLPAHSRPDPAPDPTAPPTRF